MTKDSIAEIGIDGLGRLYVMPENEQFTMIWRSALEVHWDTANRYLYSPIPREWTYYQWYHHMIDVVKDEYGCLLFINSSSCWVNVPDELKNEITTNIIH